MSSRREYESFLRQLCRLKNTLRQAKRALASTKRGASRSAACDKSEYLHCETAFRNGMIYAMATKSSGGVMPRAAQRSASNSLVNWGAKRTSIAETSAPPVRISTAISPQAEPRSK